MSRNKVIVITGGANGIRTCIAEGIDALLHPQLLDAIAGCDAIIR